MSHGACHREGGRDDIFFRPEVAISAEAEDGIRGWSRLPQAPRVTTMKLIVALFLLLGVFVGPLLLGEETQTGPSYFLIGNSLTWDTVPAKLDGDVQWHVDCGKSLPFIYENPEKPCVKTSTLWPRALKKKQYDFVSLQVHYGSTLMEDAAVISALLAMQAKAKIILHTGWAKSEYRVEEYAKKNAGGRMQHSPVYFRKLLEKLRELHPDREFRLTYAQNLLHQVAEDIESGKAPFEKIEDVYRDAIHMNVVTGRYLMHNAMRLALGQPTSAEGFPKIGEKEKAYFDSVLAARDEIGARVDAGGK